MPRCGRNINEPSLAVLIRVRHQDFARRDAGDGLESAFGDPGPASSPCGSTRRSALAGELAAQILAGHIPRRAHDSSCCRPACSAVTSMMIRFCTAPKGPTCGIAGRPMQLMLAHRAADFPRRARAPRSRIAHALQTPRASGHGRHVRPPETLAGQPLGICHQHWRQPPRWAGLAIFGCCTPSSQAPADRLEEPLAVLL